MHTTNEISAGTNGKASLTFAELREANKKRCEAFFHPILEWTPTDWGCAASGELGETCNLLKKRLRGENIPDIEVAHEIADTVMYLDLLSTRLGIDLGESVRAKFNIVSDRKKTDIKL